MCTYNVTYWRVRQTIVGIENQKVIAHSDSMFVALVIHQASVSAIFSSLACLALSYFSVLCHKRHDFRKRVTENEIYVLRFSTPSFRNVSLSRIQEDSIINVHRSSCKVPAILVRFLRYLNFLDRCYKNNQLSHFTKIRSVEAETFHADRRR